MISRLMLCGVLLALSCCAAGAGARAESQRKRAAGRCPDERAWTGKYENHAYGFSFVIPRGRKAFWNSAGCVKDGVDCVCMTDHGRSIPLSKDARIEVYAGFQSDPDWSVRDLESNSIEALKKHAGVKSLRVLSSSETMLGPVAARKFVLSFREKGRARIQERVLALHETVEYDLVLSTTAASHLKDRQEFESVLKSWRFLDQN